MWAMLIDVVPAETEHVPADELERGDVICTSVQGTIMWCLIVARGRRTLIVAPADPMHGWATVHVGPSSIIERAVAWA